MPSLWLLYQMPTPWLAIMDALVIRRRMAVQSAEALHRLKRILEREGATRST